MNQSDHDFLRLQTEFAIKITSLVAVLNEQLVEINNRVTKLERGI